jgi:hypothetical protein
MSTGGLFKLITNDGKQDMMLMATSLLNQRLADVRAQRASLGLDDTPTLLDIERTHILFTNAHFKPFAAVGFEYNIVSIQTGSIQWGSEVSFNIPQFGDFFVDMAVAVTLNQPVLVNDGVASTADNAPLMRWCAYPGERIFDQVKFEVGGNILDDYYSYEVNFFREYNIAPNKITGWNRLVGQEEAEVGTVDQPSWVGNGTTASAVTTRQRVSFLSGLQTPTGQKTGQVQLFIPLLFWFNQDVRLAIPSVAIPQGSRYVRLKLTQAGNMAGVVPRSTGTWASPNGHLDFTNVIQNIQLYVNNIFVNPEVHNIFIKRVGFTLIRVHRRQTFTTTNPTYELQCQQLKWPIEYIYAAMKMSDYNSTTAALQAEHLDKWHVFNQVVPQTRTNSGWAAKKLTVQNAALSITFTGQTSLTANNNVNSVATRLTLTGNANAVTTVANTISGGDILQLTSGGVTFNATVYSVAEGTVGSPPIITFEENTYSAAQAWGTVAATFTLTSNALVVARYRSEDVAQTSTVWTYQPTMSQINIKAHGIDLYQYLPGQFYASYLPFVFGGPNINTPQDRGCHFINFAIYPGTYQPSGHVNISRAREFYFNYQSNVIGGSPVAPSVVNQPTPSTNSNSGYLYLLAAAINFLLVSDGGAVLRYST